MAAPKRHKESVITFKADASLLQALRNIPNRSEFIRSAILGALASYCPLCRGTGVLSPNQKTHWDEFARRHPLRECEECHEEHLICAEGDNARPLRAGGAGRRGEKHSGTIE